MKPNKPKGGNVLDNIRKLEEDRANRRKVLEEKKQEKASKQALNAAAGRNVDIDYDIMIQEERASVSQALNHVSSSQMNICVCVRKRPLFDRETRDGEIDVITCCNPKIIVHEPKVKVDGITKYIQNQEFTFDNSYSEAESSNELYKYQIKDLLPTLFQNGVVTLFAYGQTGSGKTFTVSDTTQDAVIDLFALSRNEYSFYMSFFEIYGGKVSDLLNDKKKLQIQEDANSKIQVSGLTEQLAQSADEMNKIIEYGHAQRTTHSTAANDTSSRSHAICQIKVRDSIGKEKGKLLLVDLAGSERAADCQSNNRQRRLEGAEINKSLLALKECIRALDAKSSHVPFRASKLTMVLRDSFLNPQSSKIVMIACINPGSSSADHTINTLRYANRLKSDESSNVAYANPQSVGYMNQNQVDLNPQQMKKHAYPVGQKQAPQTTALPAGSEPQDLPVAQQKKPMRNLSNNEQAEQRQKHDPLARVNNNLKMQKAVSSKQSPQPPTSDERKRAQWGAAVNPANPTSAAAAQNPPTQQSKLPPQPMKPPTNPNSRKGSAGGNQVFGREAQLSAAAANANDVSKFGRVRETPEQKKQKMDDLRMTLGHGRGGADNIDKNILTFHEKADDLLEQQEELRLSHLDYLKEVVTMITEQGELIQMIRGSDEDEDNDIEKYVNAMEKIVERNLEIYTDMKGQLSRFKTLLKEEEEAAQNASKTYQNYWKQN